MAEIDHDNRRIELDPAAYSSSFPAAARSISSPKRVVGTLGWCRSTVDDQFMA
jgi:hypothetical protein